MNLVTRLALGGLDGSRHLFARGGSLGQRRSIHHLVPCLGQPRDRSNDSPAAAAAKHPNLVLLDSGNSRRVVRDDDSMAADNNTLAESLTSMGQHHLRVSFRLAAPPAVSFLCYHYSYVGTVRSKDSILDIAVVAAHGDSILLRMTRERRDGRRRPPTYDNFMYRAGTGTRPPSLTLLPGLSIPRKYDRPCFLFNEDTGILRRGEDDLLVAQVHTGEHDDRPDLVNLCVLRLGWSEWEHKRAVPILHEESDELTRLWSDPDMTIPVGDRFLCWLHYRKGLVVCDMAEEASPKLRHVPLPVYYDSSHYTNELPPLSDTKGMGAAGPGAVRFVAIEPRCCCGRLGRSSCARSRFSFTVTLWTLILTMDKPMAWVKDGVLDSEELWAMPGYEVLPRMHLHSPMVSLDNPDVICFNVGGRHCGNQNVWMVEVDTRRKALLAAVAWTEPWTTNPHIPAQI